MNKIHYYILDTESSGLKTGFHELNQISVIRASDSFQKTLNIAVEFPERASPQALAIQRKTYYDLKNGVTKKEAVDELNEFFLEDGLTNEHRCIVAHNASFDRRFLHATWESLNNQFPANLWMCTQSFTRAYAKMIGLEKVAKIQCEQKAKFGLDKSMQLFDIKQKSGAHNAVIDTQNLLNLWKNLMATSINHVKQIKRIPHILSNNEQSNYLDYEF